MSKWMLAGALVFTIVLGTLTARLQQTPAVRAIDEVALREYAGVYQWAPNAFLYLQLWNEFSGFTKPSQLVAFDESGEVRTLYPTDRDQFFAGPGIAVPASIESRIEFQRDGTGKIAHSRGGVKVPFRVPRDASRSRNVKTSASRVVTFS